MGVTDIFIILIVVMTVMGVQCVKTHQIVIFKDVQLTVCQLFFNNAISKRKKRDMSKY